MKPIKYYFLLLFVLLGCLPASVHAEEGKVGYDIQAVIPENQIDKSKSHFDLRMTPGQEQTIQVIINNTSAEETTFKIAVNQAYTNDQGFIDYSADIPVDNSQNYPIKDMIQYPSQVSVPANSSEVANLTIHMPDDPFDGQLLAGIQVTKKEDETAGRISNSYGYILGLKLTETDTEIKRALNLLSVKPDVSFGSTSIVAKLQNPTMDAYGHLKYHAKVKSKKNNQVVRTVDYDNDMQMAPNSTYKFAINWQNKPLTSGKYQLNLKVSDAKNNLWQFDQDFEITSAQASKINELTIAQSNHTNHHWWLVFIVVLLAFLIFFILWKRRKDQKEEGTKN